MRSSGRGAIRGTRSVSEGGGAVPLRTATAAVCDRGLREREPAARPAEQVLADRADAGALGDDGAEPGVGGSGLQHHLAADGEADPADAAVLTSGRRCSQATAASMSLAPAQPKRFGSPSLPS